MVEAPKDKAMSMQQKDCADGQGGARANAPQAVVALGSYVTECQRCVTTRRTRSAATDKHDNGRSNVA